MSKLHIFDMDGTLLAGSACLELSRHMGEIDSVSEMEERWGRGEIGHVEFYELLLPLWEGMEPGDVEAVFQNIAWLNGIKEVWEDIDRRGEHSALISLSPRFFADLLLPWGLHTVHAADVLAGESPMPERVLTPESKVYIAAELLERYGLGDADCVAYGDSSSDVPLFKMLSNSVSVNGTDNLRRVATTSYEGGDLREAYAAGRELLEVEVGNR